MNLCPDRCSRWPRLICLFCLLLMGLAGVCLGQAGGPFPLYGDYGLHDPGTLIKDGSRYYVFTAGGGNKYSTDLRNWTAGSPAFPSGLPAWAANAVPGYDPKVGQWKTRNSH